jgi:hypothetical protein
MLIGVGFGFSIPTIIGSATHDLPADLSATGSAVVNSGRHISGVFGASLLVVILGKADVTEDPTRFYDLWRVAAALCAERPPDAERILNHVRRLRRPVQQTEGAR